MPATAEKPKAPKAKATKSSTPAKPKAKPTTMMEAAEKLLTENGAPLRSDTITQIAIDRKIIAPKGKTPAATMAAQLAVAVKNGDERFVRTAPGTFGIKGRDRKGQKEKVTA